MNRNSTILLVLLAPALLAGCVSTPEPPPPFTGPALTASLVHFEGSPLSGPIGSDSGDAEAYDALTVSVVALERLPEDLLAPAALAAYLIVSPEDGRSIRSTSEVSREVRIGAGGPAIAVYEDRRTAGDLGRSADVAAARGALRPGVTARLDLTGPEGEILTLLVTGPAGAPTFEGPLLLGLVLEGRVEVEGEEQLVAGGEVEAQPPPETVSREEVLLLRAEPEGGAHQVILVVPTALGAGTGAALALRIDVRPAEDSAEHAAAVERCRRELRETTEALAAASSTDGRSPPVWPGLAETIGPDATRPADRRTLAYLARSTGAPLAEDVALATPDDVVAALADRIFARLRAEETWPERDRLAWILEREAHLELAGHGEDADPVLVGILVRHAGEVGRHDDLLEELVGAATSVADFESRLLAENLVFLEDNDPGARIRAFDWLDRRGDAPEGYDPLTARKERRDALRRAATAAEAEGER